MILFHYGWTFIPAGFGVMFFFVISGFLITWVLLKEQGEKGSVSLKNFYLRRALRIFPALYCFWILVTALLLITHRQIRWGQAISALFYVSNYYQGLHHYPSTPYSLTWSLSIEEQFYLLWPITFRSLIESPKQLVKLLASLIVLVWVWRIVLTFRGAPSEYIYTAFETRLDHLLVGCLLAICLRQGFASRFVERLTRSDFQMLVPFGGLLLSMAIDGHYGVKYRNAIGFIVDPVLICMLLVQLLASNRGASRWLDWKPIAFLGTISYSTYLYHETAFRAAERIVAKAHLPSSAILLIGLALSYLVAAASFFFIESRFLRFKHKNFGYAHFGREAPLAGCVETTGGR